MKIKMLKTKTSRKYLFHAIYCVTIFAILFGLYQLFHSEKPDPEAQFKQIDKIDFYEDQYHLNENDDDLFTRQQFKLCVPKNLKSRIFVRNSTVYFLSNRFFYFLAA